SLGAPGLATADHDPGDVDRRAQGGELHHRPLAADLEIVAVSAQAQHALDGAIDLVETQGEHWLDGLPDLPGRVAPRLHLVEPLLVLESIHAGPEAGVAVAQQLLALDETRERLLDELLSR